MSDTLILNSNGKPVSVMPLSTVHWHLSVKLLWLNKASVLEYHDDWVLHSPSSQITVPSVMMLREYMNFSKKQGSAGTMYICETCSPVNTATVR